MDNDQTDDDQVAKDALPAQQARPRHAVEVVPDPASLAARATEWLVEQIVHAVARRGRAVLSLSGGTTPKAVFEMLAQPPWRARIEWEKLDVFWGDERFVASDDPASNARMTYAALLDHVDMPAAHIYPIPSDEGPFDGDVEAAFARAQSAATLYATSLHAYYGGDKLKDDQPLFDVVMLGLGEDGHTASLFPGTPALDEHTAWTAAVKTDNATAPVRITMTYPLIESTHAVLFLVAGDGKRAIVKRVLDGDESLPAARVHPHGGTLWILDEAAGGRGDQGQR
jgi:6-phosphogluconolactonase